ncbi:MAG: hypothetical protein K2W95_01035 [Candidatus Obscuribacterales bacterium]|nr:hypothetical protein [Candidatus Obscuribacterales bacterium]
MVKGWTRITIEVSADHQRVTVPIPLDDLKRLKRAEYNDDGDKAKVDRILKSALLCWAKELKLSIGDWEEQKVAK